MRIAWLIQKNYSFIFDLLKTSIPLLSPQHTTVGIICLPDRLGCHQGATIYKKYWEIFGPKIFFKLVLKSFKQRARQWGNYFLKKTPFVTFKGLSSTYGIQMLHFSNPQDPELIQWVRNNNIDCLLNSTDYILKRALIEAPKLGILNKHSSLLPANRGLWPVFWSLLKEEPLGITFHRVTEDIDAGPIVLQKTYERQRGLSVYDYYQLIFQDTSCLLMEALGLFEKGLSKKVENPLPSSYQGLPSPQDYFRFKQKGLQFV